MQRKRFCPYFREEPGASPGLSRNCKFERTSQIFPAIRSRVIDRCTIRQSEGSPEATGGPFENRYSSKRLFFYKKNRQPTP